MPELNYENENTCNENYKTNLPPVYLISLESAQERLKKVSKKLNDSNVEYQKFNAINGYSLNITSNLINKKFLGHEIKNKTAPKDWFKEYSVDCTNGLILNFQKWKSSAGELGCWCSHASLWKKMIDENIDKMIILEDDMNPLNVLTFKSYLAAFAESLPENFDFAFADFYRVRGSLTPMENITLLSVPSKDFKAYGAHVYIASKSGAKKILSAEYYNNIEDVFIWNQYNNGQLNIYTATEKFASVTGEESLLNQMGRGLN